MAYVDVKLPNGDRSLGTAFHVGEGVFVTARHVVENNSIIEVKITEHLGILAREYLRPILHREPTDEEVARQNETYRRDGEIPRFRYYHEPLHVSDGPYFSSAADLDVAVFRVDNLNPAAGIVTLGVHWDDWIYRVQWQMSEAVVLGYPDPYGQSACAVGSQGGGSYLCSTAPLPLSPFYPINFAARRLQWRGGNT
jgi:hypothetical protein